MDAQRNGSIQNIRNEKALCDLQMLQRKNKYRIDTGYIRRIFLSKMSGETAERKKKIWQFKVMKCAMLRKKKV